MADHGSGGDKSCRPSSQSGQRPQSHHPTPTPSSLSTSRGQGANKSTPPQTRSCFSDPNPPYQPPPAHSGTPVSNPKPASTRAQPSKSILGPKTTNTASRSTSPETTQRAGRTPSPETTQRAVRTPSTEITLRAGRTSSSETTLRDGRTPSSETTLRAGRTPSTEITLRAGRTPSTETTQRAGRTPSTDITLRAGRTSSSETTQRAGRTHTPEHTQTPQDYTPSQGSPSRPQPSTSKAGHGKKKHQSEECGDAKRTRKPNWCSDEETVLVEQMREHEGRLSKRSKMSGHKKTALWEEITSKVNSVGNCKHTQEEVVKKWSDLKRRTKDKMTRNYNASQVTGGGGPAPEEQLTDLEEQVASIIPEETMHGVAGHDTLSMLEMGEPLDTESDLGDDVSITQQEHGSPYTQEALAAKISDTELPVMLESTTPPMLSSSPSPTHHSDAICDVGSAPLAFSPGPSVPVSTHLSPVMTHTQYVSFQRNVNASQVELVNEVQSGFATVVKSIQALIYVLQHPSNNTGGGAIASNSKHGHVQSLSEKASAACGQQPPSQPTDALLAHIQAQERLQDQLCRRLDDISHHMLIIHRHISSVLRELANANAVILPTFISLLGRRPTGTTEPGPSGVPDATYTDVPTTESPPRSDHQSEEEDNGHSGCSSWPIQKPRK